ncbi:MAG: aspartyl protease family protein, partial [Terriglobales bacterium]
MKRILCIASVVLIASTICAQTAQSSAPAVDDAALSQRPPEQTLLGRSPITVPMLKINNRPAIDAYVNGKGPFKLAVETGADVSSFSQTMANQLGLVASGHVQIGPNQTVEMAHVDSVSVGGVTYKGLTVLIGAFADASIDGFLGTNVFTQHLLKMDFDRRLLTFSKGALPAPNGRDIFSLTRTPTGQIDVNLTIGDSQLPAAIDTRGEFFISLPENTMAQYKLKATGSAEREGGGVSLGRHRNTSRRLAVDAQLGRYRILTPVVTFAPLPFAILGRRFIENFGLTLDLSNLRVKFDRAETTIEIPTQPWETANEDDVQSAHPAPAGAADL